MKYIILFLLSSPALAFDLAFDSPYKPKFHYMDHVKFKDNFYGSCVGDVSSVSCFGDKCVYDVAAVCKYNVNIELTLIVKEADLVARPLLKHRH